MDVQQILNRLRVPHRLGGQHHHVRPGWVGVDCPRCSPRSGKFKLGISLSDGRATCWTCGGTRLGAALSELTDLPLAECLGMLDGLAWRRPERPRPPAGRLLVPPCVGGLMPQHRSYLAGRGFDPDEVAAEWGVGGIGHGPPRLAWRLFLPVARDGEAASWTTRAIGPAARPRYVSARPDEEAAPLKTLLYGMDKARHAVVAVEGPLDAWALGPGAVALLGLVVTEEQENALSRFSVRAVCFDAEPAAQASARRLCARLQRWPGETHLVELETGKDAAEADNRELEEIRRKFLK